MLCVDSASLALPPNDISSRPTAIGFSELWRNVVDSLNDTIDLRVAISVNTVASQTGTWIVVAVHKSYGHWTRAVASHMSTFMYRSILCISLCSLRSSELVL